MLGAVLTLIFCVAVSFYSLCLLSRWPQLDPALKLGLAGLIGLGGIGTLTLFLGLIPGFINHAAWLFFAYWVLTGAFLAIYPKTRRLALGSGKFQPLVIFTKELPFIAVLLICGLIAFVGMLSPPTMVEWDSLAYHLAVPKLWLEAGRIYYIPYIHHSNFPFVFDGLYIWGLQWGGEPASKAFVLFESICGGLTIFGLARTVYGRWAAWWAVLAYATVPVVLWLSGTAYIDVPNGLCAGLGIAFAALWLKTPNRSYLWLAAIMLGLATASKYTGLQTIGAVGLVLLVAGIKRGQFVRHFKAAVAVGLIAVLIACPWYIKNVAWAGNPVYPFFYTMLGGKNWSADQARIYTHEQQTFGVGVNADTGKHDIRQLGHAVLGLAYQPGRYINADQEHGGGTPLGAIGVPILCAILAWAFSGKARAFEMGCLAAIGVSFLLWFYLSQQSRYIVTLTIPAAVLFGGGIVRLRGSPLLAGIGALQALYSMFLVGSVMAANQLPVALGTESRDEYLAKSVGFYPAAQYINANLPPGSKVALYDEVFGYLLDVPYFWANPGHSNVIPYASMRDGRDFVREMRQLGFTHVYVNLSPSVRAPDDARRWVAAMGLSGRAQPFSPAEQRADMNNFEQRFVPLIADAAARGDLRLVKAFRGGVLFEIVDGNRTVG